MEERPGCHLSVVAPCYNEQDSLDELYRRVGAVCSKVVGEDWELVLVDDGSRDSTWSLITRLAEQDRHVAGLSLSRNHGHQVALTAGLAFCRGRRILILDADLQDPPELLPRMMELMDQGADVVYGRRNRRSGETVFKKATAKLFYRLLQRMVDLDIPLDTGDFRLISRRVLDVLKAMPEQHRFVRGMVSWAGFRQVPLFYEREERFAGRSNYSWRKLVGLAADGLLGFSTKPLRLAVYLGVVCGLVGLGGLACALSGWVSGQTGPGWVWAVWAVLLVSGAQFMVLGIMGEYLGRIYLETRKRPLYVIAEMAGRTEDQAAVSRLRS